MRSLLAQEWVDRARAVDDPYEIAHALIMYSAALQWTDEARSLETAEEAVRIARTDGIASALSIGLTMLAGLIPLDDVARAIALLDEAIVVATSIGDRMAASTRLEPRPCSPRDLGSGAPRCRRASTPLSSMLRLGTLQALNGAFWPAAIAFVGLGQLETGAVLIAAADARGIRWWTPDALGGITPATDAAVWRVSVKHETLRSRAQGAAMSPADAVAYLRAEVDRVLGDEPVA